MLIDRVIRVTLCHAKRCVSVSHLASFSRLYDKVITNPDEIVKLFREQSQYPSLSRADIGPVITTQYGGKYSNIYTGRALHLFPHKRQK